MISKHTKLFILIICCVVLFIDNLFAEVLRARCPFTCQTQNLPKQFCKDWRKGDTCYIDVTGSVVRRACPFTCKTEGINKADCRDWREGNTCYIHDLRRNTSYRSNINDFAYDDRHHHDSHHRGDDYYDRRPAPRHDYRGYDFGYRDDYRRVPPRDYYRNKDGVRPLPPRDYSKSPNLPPPPAPQPAPRKTTGKVTKKPCPYSCRTEGISKNKCRDWKEGGLCVIERL